MSNKQKYTDNRIFKNNKEYIALGLQAVKVGVDVETRYVVPDTDIIVTRPITQGKEIYNLTNQKRSAWFIVDLETGKRGWFPGCVVFGKTTENTDLKAAPEDTATTITLINTNTAVQILSVKKISECISREDAWYKIKYNSSEGYIKMNLFEDLHYGSPII